MRYETFFLTVVILLAGLAAEAFAAPKRAKKPPTKPSATDSMLVPSQSTFITYDVGTLRLTGKSTKDTTYSIGTLRLTGRTHASTIYSVGTLRMIGAIAAPATYNVGTLSMTGKLDQ